LLIFVGSMMATAAGMVTTQLSPTPPASSRHTVVCESSVSRLATTHPAEPPPTTT